jgi:hypothetical protein
MIKAMLWKVAGTFSRELLRWHRAYKFRRRVSSSLGWTHAWSERSSSVGILEFSILAVPKVTMRSVSRLEIVPGSGLRRGSRILITAIDRLSKIAN